MTSTQLSLSAREILQSLDELDEETNLSLSYMKSSSFPSSSASQSISQSSRSMSKSRSKSKSKSKSRSKSKSSTSRSRSRSSHSSSFKSRRSGRSRTTSKHLNNISNTSNSSNSSTDGTIGTGSPSTKNSYHSKTLSISSSPSISPLKVSTMTGSRSRSRSTSGSESEFESLSLQFSSSPIRFSFMDTSNVDVDGDIDVDVNADPQIIKNTTNSKSTMKNHDNRHHDYYSDLQHQLYKVHTRKSSPTSSPIKHNHKRCNVSNGSTGTGKGNGNGHGHDNGNILVSKNKIDTSIITNINSKSNIHTPSKKSRSKKETSSSSTSSSTSKSFTSGATSPTASITNVSFTSPSSASTSARNGANANVNSSSKNNHGLNHGLGNSRHTRDASPSPVIFDYDKYDIPSDEYDDDDDNDNNNDSDSRSDDSRSSDSSRSSSIGNNNDNDNDSSTRSSGNKETIENGKMTINSSFTKRREKLQLQRSHILKRLSSTGSQQSQNNSQNQTEIENQSQTQSKSQNQIPTQNQKLEDPLTKNNNNSKLNTNSNHNNMKNPNPTGMVISAPDLYFAKEAILDPTWLDSFDDDDDDNLKKEGIKGNTSKLHQQNQHQLSYQYPKQSIKLTPNGAIIGSTNHSSTASSASSRELTSSSGSDTHSGSHSGSGSGNSSDSTTDSYCSASDQCSVSSKSLSLASSLSVGSCGFGKLSLGGSLSLASSGEEDDDDDDELLSYADVIDMGITSYGKNDLVKNFNQTRTQNQTQTQTQTNSIDIGLKLSYHGHKNNSSSNRSRGSTSTSSSSSHDEQASVLEQLYDMEKMNYLSDECNSTGSEMSSDDVDDSDSHRENNHHEKEDKEENQEKSKAYLPSHLLTPPRVKRQHQQEPAKSKIQVRNKRNDEDVINEDGTVAHANSHEKKNNIIIDKIPDQPSKDTENNTELDDESKTSSTSADTDVHSNTSPSKPISLDCEGLGGIVRGDSVLSILDCPGKRTRKKQVNRSKSSGRKKINFNYGSANDFNWCGHSVQQSIHMVRKLRSNEGSTGDKLVHEDFFKSSVSPSRIGRTLMTNQSPTKNHSYSHLSYDSDETLGSDHSDPIRAAHRTNRLESAAVRHLQTNDYEECISFLEQILSVYANQLDTYQRFGENVDECNLDVGTTLHNMGIVHLLNGNFDDSIQLFKRALEIRDCNDSIDNPDRNATFTMIGLAYYAVEDFVAAKKCWNKAMDSLKKTKKTSATLRAELLNNLGCIHYEIGNETNAVKMFQESLVIQREAVISDVYDNGKAPNKSMLMKLATIQANIAYVHLRSKNVDAAISSFESCRKDYELILDDHHPFALAIMDYTALAHLRKGDKNNAIMMYSKMLTAQIIFHEGGDNLQCAQTLIKLNMLQAKKKNKKSIHACLKKVKEFLHENRDPCQHLRLEKLLKLSGVVMMS